MVDAQHGFDDAVVDFTEAEEFVGVCVLGATQTCGSVCRITLTARQTYNTCL